ncbi:MAG TPA: hypothetical protein VLM38_09015 [Blastocatellia bacterium]|nr:hypothetical protein [Blastocatellia bacterium]
MFRKGFLGTEFGVVALMLSLMVHSAAGNLKDKKVRAEGKPVLWQQPDNIASRNLLLGPGGEELKPDLSTITFIKEEPGGYSKKYRVRDGSGHEWVAKIGKESQSEAAASRLLWAVGYNTDITYLVPRVTIAGKGTFENVRLEARPENVKRLDEWKWDDNPFIGTPEFQGLKVMMVLLENWDIKDSNNKILQVHKKQTGEDELRYVVSDLGGTLGKTGGIASRSRNKPADFVKAKFVEHVRGNRVELNYNGKRKDLFRDITVDQARWIGGLLSQLSDDQIGDAFRAANYSPQEVQMLTAAIRSRIDELAALSESRSADRH